MIHLDLFSGIGGFALAAERVWPDIEHVFVENDPFCQSVLKKHWPNSEIHGDIKLFTYTQREGYERGLAETGQAPGRYRRPFILTGGFPCQPFSQAGRRKGTADDRYLWREMFAVIRDAAPEWVIAENVRGLITWNEGMVLETVCTDLEGEGYEVWPIIIPACAVGAPHRRDRIWIIAHTESGKAHAAKPRRLHTESRSEDSNAQNTVGKRGRGRVEGGGQILGGGRAEIEDEGPGWEMDWPEAATRFCPLDDELPDKLVRPKRWRNAALKACGNAIVPAVAEQIMIAIKSSTL